MKDLVTIRNLPQATRLDRVLRDYFPQTGRQAIQGFITAGKVQVNGRKVWLCSWQVKNGDQLCLSGPLSRKPTMPNAFQDKWLIAQEDMLIVVNKPAGLLSQATRWAYSPRRGPCTTKTSNLLDLAIDRFGPLSLFHRLDRDTSGLVLLTRDGVLNAYLDRAFKERTIQKEYIALIGAKHTLEPEGVIKTRLAPHPKRRDMMCIVQRGGKLAITRYRLEDTQDGTQRVRLWPETGRTHQLRVHLAFLGTPILGDRLYGQQSRPQSHLMLHAYQISLPTFAHFPKRIYTAPLPKHLMSK